MRLPKVLKASGRAVTITDEEAHRLRHGKFSLPKAGSFSRRRRRWEDWELIALRVMARAGRTAEEIAEALGRPVESVKRRLRECGR